jgi:hypothetical protein
MEKSGRLKKGWSIKQRQAQATFEPAADRSALEALATRPVRSTTRNFALLERGFAPLLVFACHDRL